jgi:ADP-ribose pyrophosphatase YjhB (NUDIX family)
LPLVLVVIAADQVQEKAMTVRTCLDDVLTHISTPEQGLPDEVFDFIRKVTPLINVDLLVRRDGMTLLAWREDEYETGWHIPGGIVRFRESLQSRIDAVAATELGATVDSESDPCVMNQLRHHERGHFISLLYRCKLTSEINPSRVFSGQGRPRNGDLGWIRGVPDDLYPAQRFYEGWLRQSP